MKIKVRYKQKYDSLGIYSFYRIIDFTPSRKLLKDRLKTKICTTYVNSKVAYCNEVRKVLSMTKEEVKDWILPDIKEYLKDPNELCKEIRNVEIELDI